MDIKLSQCKIKEFQTCKSNFIFIKIRNVCSLLKKKHLCQKMHMLSVFGVLVCLYCTFIGFFLNVILSKLSHFSIFFVKQFESYKFHIVMGKRKSKMDTNKADTNVLIFNVFLFFLTLSPFFSSSSSHMNVKHIWLHQRPVEQKRVRHTHTHTV